MMERVDQTHLAEIHRRFITGVMLGMSPKMLRPYVTGRVDGEESDA